MAEQAELPKAGQGEQHPPIPADAMIVLPVRQTVLFPGIVLPLAIGRKSSIAAAQEAVRTERTLGVVLQKDPAVEEPTAEQLHSVGTAAQVLRYVTAPDGTHHVIAQGVRRFRVIEYLDGFPFLVARIEEIGIAEVMTPDIEARVRLVKGRAQDVMQLLPNVPGEVAATIEHLDSPSALADFIAGILDAKPAEKQDVLETIDIKERLDKVLALLAQRFEVLKISKEIGDQTQQSLSSQQREHILREQLRHIQKELGEGDEKSTEVAELREAIEKAGMPQEAGDQAKKELKRLERMPDASPEFGMIRSYLDWLIGLPWSKSDSDAIDIAEARRILDEDHYGLAKIKRRILEYLAVRKLNPNGRSPILCFVGPPGVGKTSLGQSIAKATGRKFVRLSLGGVHDEAEIRGHRRTYIGALPGNIIQSIRKAGTHNPVMMLDEVDKLGQGFHGDPSSALLEVLDPEQNSTFRDNYLGVAFDLSKVMFIATANVLDTIPGPVRDRMEVIELPGYTEDEKLEIAKRYLLRRQLEQTGLTPDQCEITEDAIRAIIRDYTREAGVRNLERLIGAVCRHVAMRVAEGTAAHVRIDAAGIARHPRCAPVRERSRHAHQRAGGRDRARLDAHRWRHPVHRGDAGSWTRQSDPHRTAWRGDEGKCAGGADAGEGARAGFRHRPGHVRKIRRAHPRAGGRHPQGWSERGRRHVRGAHLVVHRTHGEQRHGDDRRNLAARSRASHRRREGEGVGGGPSRHHDGDAAGAQPEGSRGRARGGARAGPFRVAGAGRRRHSRGLETARRAGSRRAGRGRGASVPGAAGGAVVVAHSRSHPTRPFTPSARAPK